RLDRTAGHEDDVVGLDLEVWLFAVDDGTPIHLLLDTVALLIETHEHSIGHLGGGRRAASPRNRLARHQGLSRRVQVIARLEYIADDEKLLQYHVRDHEHITTAQGDLGLVETSVLEGL